jgi:hypothetical protein
MFEVATLLGSGQTKLLLQTSLGRNIDNEVAPKPSERNIKLYDKMRRKHGNWQHRKDACGRYNCFGHVFASRRAAIYEEPEIEKILKDDGYRIIGHSEAMVGDLAVYKAPHGIAHIGEIVHVDRSQALPRIEVLSKWNDSSGEDLHLIHDVWSDFDNIQIITDRPA